MKIHHLTPWLVLTGLAAAQGIRPLPSRGMMTAQSAGMVFENSLGTVVLKGPGLPAGLDLIQSGITAGVPDYSTKAIARYLQAVTGMDVDIEIDAMSTGNDLLPVVYVPTGGGEFRVAVPTPGSAWATLSLVRKVPGQSHGGDILGYYFENPGFPGQLRNDVRYEAVRADYIVEGFDPGGADIAALDYAMGQILASQGRQDVGVIESVDAMYFSVTPACAQALDALAWFPLPVDAATIFRAAYDSSGEVYELEIECRPPGPEELDVDALGVAFLSAPAQPTLPGSVQLEPGSTMYLLSFAQGSHGNEELVVLAAPETSIGQDPMVMKPLRWPGGAPLIGTESIPGMVTAICTRDPDNNIGAHTFGVPIPDSLGSGPVFSLEVQNLPGEQAVDKFAITGVVAGVPYPGASVWLGVWHGPGYVFHNLGMWPGNQTEFSFQRSLSYTWVPDPGWTGPGPGNHCTNFYEMKVVLVPPNLAGPVLGVSTTCVLRRRDYD